MAGERYVNIEFASRKHSRRRVRELINKLFVRLIRMPSGQGARAETSELMSAMGGKRTVALVVYRTRVSERDLLGSL